MRVRWGATAAAVAAVAMLVPTMRADAMVSLRFGIKPLDHAAHCEQASGAAPAVKTQNDGVLRVATFNLLHSDTDGGDRTLHDRVPLAAKAILDSDADIIGLQEVTENAGFDTRNEYPQKHGLVVRRLADALRAATGEAWSWCYSRSNPHVPLTPETRPGGGNPLDDLAAASGNIPEGGDFAEGVAILTRYPITNARARRLLPRSYEAVACVNADPFCRLDATFDARQALWGRVKTPGGMVDVFSTHLAHEVTPLSTFTKQIQMRQVLGFADQYAHNDALPDFLLGDFNSGPTSAAVRSAAAAGFVDTYRASGRSECLTPGDAGCSGVPVDGEESFTKTSTRAMSERIDYVLARVRSGCTIRVPDSHMIANTPTQRSDGRYLWPSDHVGFVSVVSCA